MARMRFSSRPRPRSIHAVISPDDRPAAAPGDAPGLPGEPSTVRWSITTWPYTDPVREEDPADG